MQIMDNLTSDKCAGCSACMSVCPEGAITMLPDDEGFLIPSINSGKCVECGLCKTVCTLGSYKASNGYNKAFAVYYDNDIIRHNSASGAYFQALAEHFLSIGGYVCGCVLDNMKVKHIITNKLSDIRRMADSKYVQSDLSDCFTKIGSLLSNGVSVLYSGTSCQTHGLKSYLAAVNIDTSGLLCVDFFCHGVPSPLIWKEYVKYIEKKKHKKAIDYRWRCKDYGWGKISRGRGFIGTVIYENKGLRYDRSLLPRCWRQIFFSNIVLRRKCYSCEYCTVDKPADITMGDFWKIEKVLPDFYDGKGTSLVIVHDPKHLKYVTEIDTLKYKETDVNDSLIGQMNAFQPSRPDPRRAEFWADYHSKGFDHVMRKYYIPPIRYIKEPVKKILFKMGLRNY